MLLNLSLISLIQAHLISSHFSVTCQDVADCTSTIILLKVVAEADTLVDTMVITRTPEPAAAILLSEDTHYQRFDFKTVSKTYF